MRREHSRYKECDAADEQTLNDTEVLPLTAENGYPLHRDTRKKILK